MLRALSRPVYCMSRGEDAKLQRRGKRGSKVTKGLKREDETVFDEKCQRPYSENGKNNKRTLPTHPLLVNHPTNFGVHATVRPALKGNNAVLCIVYAKTASAQNVFPNHPLFACFPSLFSAAISSSLSLSSSTLILSASSTPYLFDL